MADIPQWRRRKMQHMRPKTPSQHHDSDDRHSDGSTSEAPRRRSRHRPFSRSSKLGLLLTSSAASKQDSFSSEECTLSEPVANIYQADPEMIMLPIMSRLTTSPWEALPAQLNGTLFHLLESYRLLQQQNTRLEEEVRIERLVRDRTEATLQDAGKRWVEEKQAYKDEVKRLEILIANGKRGIADLMVARQDSMVRSRRRDKHASSSQSGETWYEFMMKTATEDGGRRKQDGEQRHPSQRTSRRLMAGADVQYSLTSPSRKMSDLSRRLAMTSCREEIPCGTPPSPGPSRTLASASYLTDRDEDLRSTFSSVGEPSPSEGDDSGRTLPCLRDSEFEEMRRIAAIVAQRRGLRLEKILPKLVDVFCSEAVLQDESRPSPFAPSRSHSDHWKQPGRRPPSFMPGDDADVTLCNADGGGGAAALPARQAVKQYASIADFRTLEPPAKDGSESALASPTDTRRVSVSKIPSPLQEYAFARPRREGSTSSFSTTKTAIAAPHEKVERASSSSSRLSVSTAVRVNAADKSGSGSSSRSSSVNQQMREYTNLRNQMIAAAAARAASGGSDRPSASRPGSPQHRSGGQTASSRKNSAATRASEKTG